MGGRGSNSGLSVGGAKARMDSASQKMEKYAEFAMPAHYDDSKAKKYYAAKKEFEQARKTYNKELDSKVARTKTNTKKTFVNSYGEATTRDITTDSYKRDRKRLQRRVERNLGM